MGALDMELLGEPRRRAGRVGQFDPLAVEQFDRIVIARRDLVLGLYQRAGSAEESCPCRCSNIAFPPVTWLRRGVLCVRSDWHRHWHRLSSTPASFILNADGEYMINIVEFFPLRVLLLSRIHTLQRSGEQTK